VIFYAGTIYTITYLTTAEQFLKFVEKYGVCAKWLITINSIQAVIVCTPMLI